jgi:leader peptidase (prepilin peptidase)/N-methyltransferase
MLIEIVFFALLGLVFGSFCNVLIYRLPRNIPIGMSRSRCNDCGAQIKAYDNIPVLSFLLLRGKCRSCGSRISLRYPLVELFVCFLWIVPVLLGQPVPQALVSALFTTALTVIAIVDFGHLIVPDSMVITIAALSIPGFALQFPPRWPDRLIGGFAAGAFFYLLAVLSEKVLKKEGMGGGDIKLIAAAGLVLGWQLSALSIGLSAAVALIMIVLMRLSGHQLNAEKQLPFAPALTFAMAISHYFGAGIIHWYLHSFIG